MRTSCHLRKIEPCTRSCGWPELAREEQEVQQEAPLKETPLLITGAMGNSRMLHTMEGGGDGLQGMDQDQLPSQGGPEPWDLPMQEEQGQGVQEGGREPVIGRRDPVVSVSSPRVRKEERDKDFLYY